jgi:hypothetical protein
LFTRSTSAGVTPADVNNISLAFAGQRAYELSSLSYGATPAPFFICRYFGLELFRRLEQRTLLHVVIVQSGAYEILPGPSGEESDARSVFCTVGVIDEHIASCPHVRNGLAHACDALDTVDKDEVVHILCPLYHCRVFLGVGFENDGAARGCAEIGGVMLD